MQNPTMCKRCGVANPGSTDLCPRCLLELGLAEDPAPPGSHTAPRTRRPAPELGELAPLFPELELVRLIGQGGMGAVYQARQHSLGRSVALKVLLGDVAAEPGFARRFEREARALASLSHPGCVVIHDFGARGEYYYLLMEYVDGANLRQLLATREVSPREALSIVGQVCDGLQYAHDQGVVHRDIKPENILVTRDGRVKILDYGLAKLMDAPDGAESQLTGSLQAMGSVHYMAPEQWKNPLGVDHRADIYSLGVVFYELLTGELPVGRFPLPSQKVEVDVRLDEVVLKALEIDPELRWQHASEVKTRMAGLDVREPARPAPVRVERRKRGMPTWAILLILFFVIGPVVGGVLLVMLLAPVALIGEPPFETEIRATLDAPPEGIFDVEPVEAFDAVAPEAPTRAAVPVDQAIGAHSQGTKDELLLLGATDSEAAVITSILEDARRRYLAAEERHSTLSWDDQGRLHVDLEPFPEDERVRWKKVREDVRLAVDAPRLVPDVRRILDYWEFLYPWGEEAVAGLIWRDAEGLHWKGEAGQGITAGVSSGGELSDSGPLGRFWKRGLELLETPK